MKRILSIIAVVFCCFFLVAAVGSAVSIDAVDCPCGCGMKAIDCSCGASIQALHDAGFTDENIKTYLETHGG